ncbi:hypothetical protein EPUS_08768 [Endocarpon pusillum Z07020]|uniref:CCHC-type domain-containing protein n=1 Tax=Endocarpon pusillum (strain Z07020 / HMAS-L-300199) TaxID=1263415 RepID=U1FYG0_ENDPU|nr:uncharacterized protein EPUS_08768 [Endocarpon pusillum Z07020]ERF69957.1 hypothetical protein EPUS_08768 [Endocarpon pusillum Z07020]
MPMDLDATKKGKRPGPPKKRWDGKSKWRVSGEQWTERRKKGLCLMCGKPGHYAKECKKNQELGATEGIPEEESHKPQRKNWADKKSMGKKGDPKETSQGQLRRSTPETSHNLLSWTACYDDNCVVHSSDKDGAGWYPRKPRSHQSLNALFTYNDDEPEYEADNDDEEPGPEAMKSYVEVLEIKKPDYVRLLTNLWTRAECFDQDCGLAAEHEHVAYDPDAIPKEQGKAFTIEFCKKKECPDHDKSEFHAHQGSDRRDLQDSPYWQPGPSLHVPLPAQVGCAAPGLSPVVLTFAEQDQSCPYHEEYEGHTHFRNYTKEERRKFEHSPSGKHQGGANSLPRDTWMPDHGNAYP